MNGEYTLENGLTLGGSLLGGALGVGGKLVSGVGGEVVDGLAGPLAGGGAKLDNLSPAEIARIQNAVDRTGTQVTVVGSRANGTAHGNSDWDFVLPQDTNRPARHRLTSSLPEGSRSLGEPRNQDISLIRSIKQSFTSSSTLNRPRHE